MAAGITYTYPSVATIQAQLDAGNLHGVINSNFTDLFTKLNGMIHANDCKDGFCVADLIAAFSVKTGNLANNVVTAGKLQTYALQSQHFATASNKLTKAKIFDLVTAMEHWVWTGTGTDLTSGGSFPTRDHKFVGSSTLGSVPQCVITCRGTTYSQQDLMEAGIWFNITPYTIFRGFTTKNYYSASITGTETVVSGGVTFHGIKLGAAGTCDKTVNENLEVYHALAIAGTMATPSER